MSNSKGVTGAGGQGRLASAAATARALFAPITLAITQQRTSLFALPGVVEARAGYLSDGNGVLTRSSGIIVAVLPPLVADPALRNAVAALFPEYTIELVPANPVQQLTHTNPDAAFRIAEATPSLLAADSVAGIPGAPRILPHAVATAAAGITIEALPVRRYKPPKGLKLDEVRAPMTVLCHASPDSGWETLSRFIADTQDSLTVAMYDFTAPHIAEELIEVLRRARRELLLILDPSIALSSPGTGTNPKAHDKDEVFLTDKISDALGSRFRFRWAAVKRAGKTTAGLFPTAYHIKVAVRDSKAFWLSSGNWQSSNQPKETPAANAGLIKSHNREWHVVVEHDGLARLFERFIEYDYAQAKDLQAGPEIEALPDLLVMQGFAAAAEQPYEYIAPKSFTFTQDQPLRVQPLLTPDNYAEHVLGLIQSAKESLLFQNQYITISESENAEEFEALLDALLDRMNKIDVKIILRDLPGARDMMESLQAHGFDTGKVKLLKGCHTKGIVVDGKVACVGSHNWSNHGTVFNRDASCIFYDKGIAGYYAKLFERDWNRASSRFSSALAMPALQLAGVQRVDWGEVLGL